MAEQHKKHPVYVSQGIERPELRTMPAEYERSKGTGNLQYTVSEHDSQARKNSNRRYMLVGALYER